jgi:hypothetical protein
MTPVSAALCAHGSAGGPGSGSRRQEPVSRQPSARDSSPLRHPSAAGGVRQLSVRGWSDRSCSSRAWSGRAWSPLRQLSVTGGLFCQLLVVVLVRQPSGAGGSVLPRRQLGASVVDGSWKAGMLPVSVCPAQLSASERTVQPVPPLVREPASGARRRPTGGEPSAGRVCPAADSRQAARSSSRTRWRPSSMGADQLPECDVGALG